MNHKEFSWKQHDTEIYAQSWLLDEPKAVVALVHGMGEHSGRYADFVVPKLNQAGLSVIAFDHFGHGKTPGKRGHCPSYGAVQDSVQQLLEECDRLQPGIPKVLYGHSMGGNVVASYLLEHPKSVKAAVLTSPMFKIAFDPPAWKMFAGRIMQNIYPAFQEKTGLDANAISRNEVAVRKYLADPLVHDKVTVNFSLPFFEAGERAIRISHRLEIPTLILHGSGDKITSYDASKEFAYNAGSIVNFKGYNGAFHELHNEPEKDDVLDTICAWFIQNI